MAAAWSALQVGVGVTDGDSEGAVADALEVGALEEGVELADGAVQPDKSTNNADAAMSAGVGAMADLPSLYPP